MGLVAWDSARSRTTGSGSLGGPPGPPHVPAGQLAVDLVTALIDPVLTDPSGMGRAPDIEV
jgi:hypothetical protein